LNHVLIYTTNEGGVIMELSSDLFSANLNPINQYNQKNNQKQ